MPTLNAFPVDTFVSGLASRGLSLSLEDADTLVLTGPKEARTDKIRAYLKRRKPQLVEYLTIAPFPAVDVLLPGRYDDRTRALVPEAEAGRLPDLLIGVGKRRMNANEFVLWATDQLQNKKPANVSPFHFVEWETKMRGILGRIADVHEEALTPEGNTAAEPIAINAI